LYGAEHAGTSHTKDQEKAQAQGRKRGALSGPVMLNSMSHHFQVDITKVNKFLRIAHRGSSSPKPTLCDAEVFVPPGKISEPLINTLCAKYKNKLPLWADPLLKGVRRLEAVEKQEALPAIGPEDKTQQRRSGRLKTPASYPSEKSVRGIGKDFHPQELADKLSREELMGSAKEFLETVSSHVPSSLKPCASCAALTFPVNRPSIFAKDPTRSRTRS
jgi:hypothetical protein